MLLPPSRSHGGPARWAVTGAGPKAAEELGDAKGFSLKPGMSATRGLLGHSLPRALWSERRRREPERLAGRCAGLRDRKHRSAGRTFGLLAGGVVSGPQQLAALGTAKFNGHSRVLPPRWYPRPNYSARRNGRNVQQTASTMHWSTKLWRRGEGDQGEYRIASIANTPMNDGRMTTIVALLPEIRCTRHEADDDQG